jgi:hypothetical protein
MPGVFRFSNAVSDIRKFIATYQQLHHELKGTPNFTHDDATKALISHGLVSSSGAIGNEALRRSTRDDRSRDPLYNQHKMYSEIYRMLGWYEPGTARTNFNFPDYGEYLLSTDERLLKKHFELNVLHIVSPNPLVEVRSGNILRPFPLLLKLMGQLGGMMHRDEIIIAILACQDDTDASYIETAKNKILALRGNKDSLENEYLKLMAENNINSKDVLRNYTRFVLASLIYLDYAQPKRIKGVYGARPIQMYMQTENGIAKSEEMCTLVDIRNEQLSEYSLDQRTAFTYYSVIFHLEKLGYEIDPSTIIDFEKSKSLAIAILRDYGIENEEGFLYFGVQESTKEEKDNINNIF